MLRGNLSPHMIRPQEPRNDDPYIDELLASPMVTAGAYVQVGQRYPFVIGINAADPSTLALVRLGGHCEADETGWQCAAREVREEAALTIHPCEPPVTFWLNGDQDSLILHPIHWPHISSQPPAPLLVVSYPTTRPGRLAVMYLARAFEQPVPSAEVHGLLLLTPHDVHALVQQRVTLGQYLAQGGQAILRSPLPITQVLVPFLQLRAFAAILQAQPRLMDTALLCDPTCCS